MGVHVEITPIKSSIFRQKYLVHGFEARALKHIPKILYVICERLVRLCDTGNINSQFCNIYILSKSCSLQCVQRHKLEAECDGIRDKVKYLPINKFTDLDVVSDFRLLEEVSKQVDK